MANRWVNSGNRGWLYILGGSKITADGDCSHEIKRRLLLESHQPRQHIKKQRHYFVNKSRSSQGYGFFSGHLWMWELDYKESWALKNWCFWTVVLEKTPESPMDCKKIQPVHPKDQSWVFIGSTDVEAETITESKLALLTIWQANESKRHDVYFFFLCTCVPHPEPPSLRVIPVYQPWAPCLMHRSWTGDVFHIW